jgi:hypothetical protein
MANVEDGKKEPALWLKITITYGRVGGAGRASGRRSEATAHRARRPALAGRRPPALQAQQHAARP